MKKLTYVLLCIIMCSVLMSCEEDETVNITLSIDKESIVADGIDAITITVLTDGGIDVTSESTIRVNNEIFTTNTFTTLQTGTYGCVAEYKSETSNMVNFEVKEVPVFVKKTVIENYTAVWCGYCPRVHDAIVDAKMQDNNIISIAIHGSNDPFYFTSISTLASGFGVEGYPTAIIDREFNWPYPESFSGLANALAKNSAIGLSIDTEISGNNLNTDVKVKFGKNYSTDLKLVVCLVESGLIEDQVNYYEDGRGNPIADYEHNNVLRTYATDLLGDDIPSSEVVKDNEYSVSYTFDASNYNILNCKVVAFVVDDQNVSINAQEVVAGGNKEYDPI